MVSASGDRTSAGGNGAVMPLHGLRVVEFTHSLAGAWAGQFMADYGAEVICIEPPGGTPLRAQRGFPMWARGKQSVVADLGDPADRERVAVIVANADVVIESFRPATAGRFALSYEQLSASNPRLVHVSITGWGTEGPYVDVPGYDHLVMAKLGTLHQFAPMGNRPGPIYASMPYPTYGASQAAIHGMLAALVERESSGVGQHVETTLVQGLAMLDVWNWFITLVGMRYPGAFVPGALFSAEGKPNGPFAYLLLVALTADGRWIQFSHSLPHLFKRFMHSLGLGEMFDDPEWAGLPMIEDNAKREAFWRLLQRTARQRTLAQWREVFDAEPDVWGELFRRGPDALEHPQMVHDGRIVTIDDPVYGPIRQPGRVVTLNDVALPPLRPAPRLGEVVIEDEPGEGTTGMVSSAVDNDQAPMGARPLDGVTVIELGVLFAAPFGATLLTDLGARVIKIEAIEGDPVRTMMPFPEVAGVKVLQGKESIAVDLTSEEGLAIVHELVRGADIVLQSFRAGAAERTKVDAATLKAINPNLVYLNAPGYGTGGPCGGRAAFAPVIAAAAGMSWRHLGTSVPEGTHLSEDEVAAASIRMSGSTGPSSVAVDSMAAAACASAMLLGLLGHRRGLGSPVMETSMLGSMAQAMSEDGLLADGLPSFPTVDDGLYGIAATYRLYECRNGWVFLAVPLSSEWRSLVEALGHPVELCAARYDDATVRNSNDPALIGALEAIFRTDDATSWEKRLGAVGIGCVVAEARITEEILMTDPLWRSLAMVVDVVHPTFDEHPRLAPVVRFSRSATAARPGCLNGQHTDAVLAELGFDPDRIADLRTRGIIGG